MSENSDKDKKTPPVNPPGKEETDSTVKDTQSAEKTVKRKHRLPGWLRWPLRIVGCLIVVVIAIPILLYIPAVQTFVKNTACDYVYKSTGMKISVDEFRLKFPVDISLKGVNVLEASGDTMANVKEVIADVKMAPLLKLDVKIKKLLLRGGFYRMVSPDSSMILRINAGTLTVDDRSSADIANSRILLNRADLKDGTVSLFMDVWKQKPSQPDSTSTPFYIAARELNLSNFRFSMSMLPTIDTLDLRANSLKLRGGIIDLGKNTITAQSLRVDSGNVTYLTPTQEYIASHPAPVDTTSAAPSAPMVIKGDTVSLARFHAIYAVKDATPLPGFDPSYIEVEDVDISLNNFYNAASTLDLPIASVSAKERSGLQITEGHGTMAIDSTGLVLKDLYVATPYSQLTASAGIPFALMSLAPAAPLNVDISGYAGMPDVEAFMPALKPMTSRLPGRSPLNVDLLTKGTLSDADIPVFKASIPGILALSAKGNAQNALDIKKLRANLDFEGSVSNPSVVGGIMELKGIKLPTMQLKGTAHAANQTYSAGFRLLTSAGNLSADGKVSMTAETYNANVNLHNVNVAYFMPEYGVGTVTATLTARGAGFNPTKAGAATNIKLDIASVLYQKQELKDITADVTLNNGVFNISALSSNDAARFHLDGSGTIAPDLYTFSVTGDLDKLNLQALGLSDVENGGSAGIVINGTASPEKWIYDVAMRLENAEWTVGDQYFNLPGSIDATFKSYADNVTADVAAERTSLRFTTPTGLKPLLDSFTTVSDSLSKQIAARDINVEGLQHALPPFNVSFNASGTGMLGKYLNTMGYSADTLYASLANDSLISARLGTLNAGNRSMRIDTATFTLSQRGKLLDYKTHIGNRPNNPLAEFADVNINGYVGSNRLLMSLMQKNQVGKTGYRLGFTAAMTDSMATVHFTPRNATIAYLPWTFNQDNHVDYYFNSRHIYANLEAASNESSIQLLSQTGKAGNDEFHLGIKNLKIQDFLRMSVFAPPLTASVNADVNVGYTQNWLYGSGNIAVKDFTYDKLRVGDFDLGLKAGVNDEGTSTACADLAIDGANALTARVWLKPDSLGVMEARKCGLELTRFPLYIANAFLGPDVARLSGYLNGSMDLQGSLAKPNIFGSIACDSVGVYVPMLGSELHLGNDSISLADNILRINNFDVWGANKNPLVLNGTINASKPSEIYVDLGMKAEKFQLINNTKKARSEIFGRIDLDMDATAKGPLEHFNINAKLNVLNTTDVTYSIPQTTAQLSAQDMEGVVKFVNLNDTTAVEEVDSITPTMSMRIVAALTIDPGAHVMVIYPGSQAIGSAKVELSPNGTLNYFQNYMGDMRLNGQLFLGDGYVNYSMPMMAGSKKFTFNPESYVQWAGELMNPSLNINASDKIRANLVQNGNSRLVNFLVSLGITNNLSAPKVLFDLSTEDDMTVENDLMSMSADQRSMAAINLLLTGQYSAQGVKTASSDMLTGSLYSALTSTVNNWMANHVKGVDLSFGVDQYDTTVNGETGSATSYSYQMSKSLFDNKFKILVGGNYTTDASADENFSENLISDISFEYTVKQTANVTMLMRLFRHTGYESILEGEITETGVGFVMKRRMQSLRQLLPWRRRRRFVPNDSTATTSPADSLKTSTPKPQENEAK